MALWHCYCSWMKSTWLHAYKDLYCVFKHNTFCCLWTIRNNRPVFFSHKCSKSLPLMTFSWKRKLMTMTQKSTYTENKMTRIKKSSTQFNIRWHLVEFPIVMCDFVICVDTYQCTARERTLKTLFNIVEAPLKITLMSVLYDDVQMDQ